MEQDAQRAALVRELVDEVIRDEQNLERIRALAAQLGIPYSEDSIQFLNNVLKGIHFEGAKNEPII